MHLTLDAAQEAQLTQVAQGQVGRLIPLVLYGLLGDNLVEQRHQLVLCQGVDKCRPLIGFRIPFRRVAGGIEGRLVEDVLAKVAVLQFHEQTAYAATLVGKVVHREPLGLDNLEEGIRQLQHLLLGIVALMAQRGRVLVEEILLVVEHLQPVTLLLIEIAEDGLTEFLDRSDDVPRAVVTDGVHDVFQEPLQQQVGGLQTLNKLVYSLFLHLHVVQTHAQVGRQVQLASQVAQHALEERVNRLHTEITVVVQQQVQGHARPFRGHLGRHLQLLAHLTHIALRLLLLTPDAVQLAQDS